MAILVTLCSTGCSQPDECRAGETPCGEEEGTYLSCERDMPHDVPSLTSDRLYFTRSHCQGNDPVCRPLPNQRHICEEREWPQGEACAQPVTLLTGLPGDRVVQIVADLNADGRADLLLASEIEGVPLGISQSLQMPDGSFGAATDILDPDGHHFSYANVGDVDGDGVTDVVATRIANSLVTETTDSALVVLLSRDAQLVPSAIWSLHEGDAVQAVADIDGDGAAELLLSTFSAGKPFTDHESTESISVLRLEGDRLVERQHWQVVMNDPVRPTVAVADFAGDGRLFLLYAGTDTTYHVFAPRDGGYVPDPSMSVPNPATFGDFDGDGATDIAVVDRNASRPYVAVGTANRRGRFAWHNIARLGREMQLFAAEVDGLAPRDLVALVEYNSKLSVIRDPARADEKDVRTFELVTSPQTIVADLDGDGRSDIVTSSVVEGRTTIAAILGSCL